MTAKWRLVATLNSRAREAKHNERNCPGFRKDASTCLGTHMGMAAAFKEAARLVAEAMNDH